MKKTLLTLAIMLLGLSAAKAENITEDWAQATWGPTTNVTEEANYTSTTTDIVYTFFNTKIVLSKNVPQYLLIYGAANTKPTDRGYISFSLPINCSEIKLKTTSGCSENVENKITVYAGDNIIQQDLAVNTRNNEYTVLVPADYRKAGTVYKICASSTKNPQFVTITYVEESAEPTLSILQTEAGFAVPLHGTQMTTIKGAANNISENISVSVDNAAFTLSSTSVTPAELAEGIEVTYTGSTAGETTATLTFTGGTLTKTVALSAITVANEGTEANPLTIADVLAMKNLNAGPFYVTGTIGDKSAANAVDGVLQTNTPVVSNLILKDSENTMIAVALPNNSTARTTLNIVDNPTNVGQTVIIKGSLENYFGIPGVKNTEYISGLTTSGIADIVADENAPVEYFNLQGIRVANPENGLYIRRQGNKVTKVIVK